MERDETVILNFPFCSYFNSHAHVERDLQTYKWCNNAIDFNSHAHVERDFPFKANIKIYIHFNSHAHVERDLVVSLSRS